MFRPHMCFHYTVIYVHTYIASLLEINSETEHLPPLWYAAALYKSTSEHLNGCIMKAAMVCSMCIHKLLQIRFKSDEIYARHSTVTQKVLSYSHCVLRYIWSKRRDIGIPLYMQARMQVLNSEGGSIKNKSMEVRLICSYHMKTFFLGGGDGLR